MAPKILILTGDAAESLEVMYPYQRLREEGYDVRIAAPTKKKLHFVVHDFEPGYDTYTEKPGYTWDADLAFADVNTADYAAVVIPGGRAPEYISNDANFTRIIRDFFDAQKPVAQLCHAPLALATAGVLKGRRTAAYPALESDIKSGRRIREWRSRDRWRHGLRARLAGSPGLDAGVREDPQAEGSVRRAKGRSTLMSS